MYKVFENSLVGLGMKQQEAKVYLACLKLGQSTVSSIAEVADIQRTFTYNVLKDLSRQGFVSSVQIRGKQHYSAISTERLKRLLENRFQQFEKIVPELKAMENTVGDRPKVQFFEGREGIKAALFDTLNQPKGSEFLAYFTGDGYYKEDQQFAKEYVKTRAKRGIKVRTIAPDTAATRLWAKHDEEQLRTTRLVPADHFPFSNEFDIYGNKLAIISLKGELLAVIIESESIAKTQKMIFELAWIGAATLDKSREEK